MRVYFTQFGNKQATKCRRKILKMTKTVNILGNKIEITVECVGGYVFVASNNYGEERTHATGFSTANAAFKNEVAELTQMFELDAA